MIAVTGANGFIGTNLVVALNRAGRDDVIAVDRFNPPRYVDAVRVARRIDADAFADWLRREGRAVEAIYHLGACSDTTVTDRRFVMANNDEYTRALWRWCADAGCPLVYASSAATYGDGSRGFDDTADPAQYRPMNLYGESKQRFDLWAREQSRTPPRWVGIKYFNVYGPFEAHKDRMASMAFHWFNQIRDGGVARLFKSYREGIADGEQQRDFVYVQDAVDATCHLMNGAGVRSGLYNVGTGRARTFADLARAVFAAVQKEPELVFVDMPEDLRPQYQYFTQAPIGKLRKAGFDRPFSSLEDGVRFYVEDRLAREGALT